MTPRAVCREPTITAVGLDRVRVAGDISIDGWDHAVWFDVPAETVSTLPSEAFALAALLPAMRAADRLVIEGPISPRLHRNLDELQALYASWFPEFRRIEVVAEHVETASPAPGIGSFFSGGVDSFYVAVTRASDIDTLVYVDALDMIDPSEQFRTEVGSRMQQAASSLGKPLTRVATNIRELVSPFTDWLMHSHVVALACVAHALGGALGTALVPADHTYRELLFRWGAHPLIPSRCSTDATAVESVGWAVPRVDRVKEIARSEVAMRHLRVCWENPGEAYNCGRCAKCLRTKAALVIAGALDDCATFGSELDLEALTAIEVGRGAPDVAYFVDSIPRALEADRRDLAAAMQQIVDRHDRTARLEALDDAFTAVTDTGEDAHEFVASHRDALYATMSAHHGRWLVARTLGGVPGKALRKLRAVGRRSRGREPMSATSLPQLPDAPFPPDVDALLLSLPGGNTGDALIRQGSERFLRESGLSVWLSDGALELAAVHGDLGRFDDALASYRGDVIFVGGGNIGIYAENARMRARVIAAARTARAILVLPQSARAAEPALTDPRVVVWARDTRSQTVLDEAGIATRLVPDTAFAMADAVPTTPGGEGTYFILRDPAHCEEWLAPPVEVDGPNSDLTWRPRLEEVVATLEPYRVVVSNRLHGGIVSMMMGKRTAFLPVAYHKIVSFYETWFADDPGAAFVDSPEALDRFREGAASPSSDLATMFWDRAAPALSDFRSI